MGLDRARRRVHGDGWQAVLPGGAAARADRRQGPGRRLLAQPRPGAGPQERARGGGLGEPWIGATISLPLLPAEDAEPVIAVNDDVGETIGWPEFARIVADVHRGLPSPAEAVILTRNYGEAGAIDRYGPDLDLPPAYSGHNAYGDWGPPPNGSAPVIAIGRRGLTEHLRACRVAARIDNRAGIENEEQGVPVMVCRGPGRAWSLQWPRLRHLR